MTDDWHKISHESVVKFATEGIKAMFLANGGAVVAILSFAGSTLSKGETSIALITVASSIRFFAWGLVATLVCSLCSYMAQLCFTHLKNRPGLLFQAGALIAAIGSIGLFLVGVETAIAGFKLSPPLTPAAVAAPALQPPSVSPRIGGGEVQPAG